MSNLIVVQTKEVPFATVTANDITISSVSVAKTGYTAIGIVGTSQNYTGGFDFSNAIIDIPAQKAFVKIRNFNSITYTNVTTIEVKVLYIKNN